MNVQPPADAHDQQYKILNWGLFTYTVGAEREIVPWQFDLVVDQLPGCTVRECLNDAYMETRVIENGGLCVYRACEDPRHLKNLSEAFRSQRNTGDVSFIFRSSDDFAREVKCGTYYQFGSFVQEAA